MVAFPRPAARPRPEEETNLAFLNKSKKPAILVEVCFVDSKADAELYRKHFDKICKAIADAIR
jgi:N-acetylmuramoyl-L-alanine amidase